MNLERSNNFLNEEIINLIDDMRINKKEKSKNFTKMKALEIIPEDKSHLDKNKSITQNKGLTENILNDFETKEKARKGLLFLMNKISGNTFCPEIIYYFNNLKKENLQNKKEMQSQIMKEEEKEISKLPLIKSNSNLKRQNLIENKISKFRIDEEEIFKLNCEPSQVVTLTLKKNNKSEEKNLVKLKKRKNDNVKKIYNSMPRFFPEKKYKNDISARDKEFKLYFSNDEDVDNNVYKNKKFNGVMDVNFKTKEKPKKNEVRRIDMLKSEAKRNYRNLKDSIGYLNNNYVSKTFEKRKIRKTKDLSFSPSQES
jgi:hypothetical protein